VFADNAEKMIWYQALSDCISRHHPFNKRNIESFQPSTYNMLPVWVAEKDGYDNRAAYRPTL